MKIFGLNIGSEKVVPFQEFRDSVRVAVRKQVAGAQFEPRDYGFVLRSESKPPTTCNLRTLYAEYSKTPELKDKLIQKWLGSLTMEIPEHNWQEAMITLRPTLKNALYVAHAQKNMQKNEPPDSLPFSPFAGELSVIVMRELPGTAVAVTQSNLDDWGVTFEQAMKQAINNMNMMQFPEVTNTINAGPPIKKVVQEELGLFFEKDHLTATWLVIPRFRDYVAQRLMGDYVAFVPLRNRMTVVRTDAQNAITNVQSLNRNIIGQMHTLTAEGYQVNVSVTGGIVTVYKANQAGSKSLDLNSPFAGQNSLPEPAPVYKRPGAVDLNAWSGLAESTED